jgi:amino acid transporter
MAGTALILAKAENLTPLIPPQFGASGIIRGATSSFFGYIGFDEICCIAGEAVDPARNMPRAIILTLVIVTSLYITASLGLTGMVPYEDISETSGFPNGFRYRGLDWAAQIAAVSIQLFQLFSPTYELHVFARLIFRFLHPTRLVNWWLYLLLYWLQSWRNLVFSMQWPKIIYYLQYLPKQMKWATLSMA